MATPFGDSHLDTLSGVWSHVRSLLLGSSLLEAFNPIDGPEVLGQVLLSDPGVGHVEVALVSPVLAPGIAHLRCVGGLEVCWLSVSTSRRPKLPHLPISYPNRKAHRVTPGQTVVTQGVKSPRHSGSDASCFEVVANFESCP